MIGALELLLIFAVILLSLGDSKLPEFICCPGKSAG